MEKSLICRISQSNGFSIEGEFVEGIFECMPSSDIASVSIFDGENRIFYHDQHITYDPAESFKVVLDFKQVYESKIQ